MIFAVIGILKQPLPPRDPGFEAALNEHFAQKSPRIVNAGYLRGQAGEPVGLLGLIEADSFEHAQAYLDQSPFQRAGHYDRTYVAAFDVEIGRLG
jgi:uncharacterized protein YciI